MTSQSNYTTSAMLELQNIDKRINDHSILKGINFIFFPSVKYGIMGATGSGKSTLLKIIAGLVEPDQGLVLYKNKKVKGPGEQLIPGHPKMAYLSQYFELPNNYWVRDFLLFENAVEKTHEDHLISICDIEHLLDRKTHELSGGEKQRIAFAKKLLLLPELLLLDEPFSNLDIFHATALKKIIDNYCQEFQATCILVAHHPQDIFSWSDQVLIMNHGEIVETGASEDIYHRPQLEYTASLTGDYQIISALELSTLLKDEPFAHEKRQYIIRPDTFYITKDQDSGIPCTIKEIIFRGPYLMISVSLGNLNLKVQSQHNNYMIGEEVWLNIDKNASFYVEHK